MPLNRYKVVTYSFLNLEGLSHIKITTFVQNKNLSSKVKPI